jgi:GNAT superfamily N-acetyltransferase
MLTKKRKRSRIIVKRATLDDIKTLLAHRSAMHEELRHRTKLEHRNGTIAYRKFIKDMTKKKRFVAFLAFGGENSEEPAGSGCVWLRETHPRPARRQLTLVPYLLSMYTVPSQRGKGVASAVVKEAMKWSKKNGFPLMTLHASERGRRVYEKLGWEQTSEMRVLLAKR